MNEPGIDGEVTPVQGLPLRPLEAATGLALGSDDVTTFTVTRSSVSPLQALISVMAELLRQGPTYVSFSGGRDSSGVLAAGVLAARRLGVPDPIPITQRFPAVKSTEESEWQQLVVDHLGITRWDVIEIGNELDLLGPYAQRVLRRHGLLWPPNAFFHGPMFERAHGARFVTGFDGDGVLGSWRWARAQSVLSRRVGPVPRDAARVALALAPGRARRPLMPAPLIARVTPWLRPPALRALERDARIHAAAEPRRWDRRLAFYGRGRFVRLGDHTLRAVAGGYGVRLANPILDDRFVSALATTGGASGFGDRTSIMRAVFGSALPDRLLARPRKAEFGRAVWGAEARAFADAWDGTGLDTELVDPALVREAWRAENPLFGSSTLLHAAWLAAHPA